AAGSDTAVVRITPVNDNEYEGEEYVILTLKNGTGYQVGGGNATIAIIDNDTDDEGPIGGEDPLPGTISITDSSGNATNRMLGLATTNVGERSYTGTFTLLNDSDAAVNVTNFKITGDHPGDFEYRIIG